MGAAVDFRQFAEEQRRHADSTPLPQVRLLHLGAAEKWEVLAEELERMSLPKSTSIPIKNIFY